MKNNPKDNKTLAILGIVLVFVLLIGMVLLSFFSRNNEAPAAASSEPVSSSEPVDSKPPEEVEAASFEEILFDTNPTMYGKTDYFSVTRLQKAREMQEGYLKLAPLTDEAGTPQTYFTGHQIYLSETTGEQYIISGETLLPVSFTGDDNAFGFLREEETGRRIHLFGNSYDLQAFLDSWDAGQRVLAGETTADEGSIIFDGCLTDSTYTQKEGELFVNLAELTPLLTDFSYYDETMGYMDVYVNDCTFVRIPTAMANEMLQESLGVVTDQFRFQSWNGEDFECWGPVLDAVEPLISIRDASMMFGWKMYTNGSVLSIVTDPLNATNLAATRASGDMGLRIVIETNDAGEKVMRAYNDAGELVWEKPFDESMVDAIEEQNSQSSPQQILEDAGLDTDLEDYINDPQMLESLKESLEEASKLQDET